MRHRNINRILGREKAQRVALLRGLSDSLILEGKMKTTLAKAKELKRYVEPLVTDAKANTLSARRKAISFLYTNDAVTKLFAVWAPKYTTRQGGYTRITKIGTRTNDRAEMAIIEFV